MASRTVHTALAAILGFAGFVGCAANAADPPPHPVRHPEPPRLEIPPTVGAFASLDPPAMPPASAADASEVPSEPVRHPFHEPPPQRTLAPTAPAMRYANLSPSACKKELRARELPMAPLKGYAKGVATPLRITGPIHGVRFVTPHAPSPFGVLDCRLGLVLDELARTLAELGVAEVRIDNMYRPQARLPRRRKRSQHAYGLAIDILSMKLHDGRTLEVERDWQTPIGAAPCGPDAVMTEATDEAIRLRTIVCALAHKRIFHHMLTPSYDAAHRNHFHFDIKREAKYGSLH